MKKVILLCVGICFTFLIFSHSIGSAGNTVTVDSLTKVVFRATDYIEITQNFELPAGSEMELITHPCPE